MWLIFFLGFKATFQILLSSPMVVQLTCPGRVIIVFYYCSGQQSFSTVWSGRFGLWVRVYHNRFRNINHNPNLTLTPILNLPKLILTLTLTVTITLTQIITHQISWKRPLHRIAVEINYACRTSLRWITSRHIIADSVLSCLLQPANRSWPVHSISLL